ncbi:glutamate synthase large subunit [Magnetospira sp. QH-2]|uniref:glutamate synthase large subunit n=1 Tax=Magnetospira sp. (strain QH-2) TaxID=1288970 RepID=UPI0003E815CC|nr:glutamate synthase large subunit [Magnetospira sp. QH-2]CCQ72088.1 Glutamate synthase, large subunit [Magnetospira sp. QH-2]
MRAAGYPAPRGLYDPANEHDACGVGFICHVKNQKSHHVVSQGLEILKNLTHRGAVGADPLAGDGAGILIQLPDAFLRAECAALGFDLPEAGHYGVGMLFLPKDDTSRATCEARIEKIVLEEGQTVLGWREVPTDNAGIGESVLAVEPAIRQVFIGRTASLADQDAFERKLYVIHKRVQNECRQIDVPDAQMVYVPSMSSRTIVYKGMLLADQVDAYYQDLTDERMVSALALVHQRFSTNTFPSWELAHPFRMICHNGEINTVRGNINWMNARRNGMVSSLLGDDLPKIWPVIAEGQSDSASFDNALELLVQGGYSMAHAMMMLVPEAWSDNPFMGIHRKAFYEYHAALMEPWDGPAAVCFTDGRQIGATLDRNGLRPARYLVTDDDFVVMGSEMGVLPVPEDKIVQKWRLQPGKMLLIDLEQGRIISDEEMKKDLSHSKPYRRWLAETQIMLEHQPAQVAAMAPDDDIILQRQKAFGYNQEDLKFFLKPMALSGQDPVGSMGATSALAVLSDKSRLLYDYFRQKFAQVTNPPIDPIREELVMSLISLIGPRPNILDLETGGRHMRLEVRQPILTNGDLEKIRRIDDALGDSFRTSTISICYPVEQGEAGLGPALKALVDKAERAIREDGYNILILSDRGMDADHVAIPALLATAAVHHHLVRNGLRTETGLVVETGEAREVHHFAVLAGYGAEAVNPYLALDSLASLQPKLPDPLDLDEMHARYIKAVDKGLLKVMSKMGISTYQSYCGAQIFDAVGVSRDFIDAYFAGTDTTVEGVGLAEVAAETIRRHRQAYASHKYDELDPGGFLSYRLKGEEHVWTPETIGDLQHAVRMNDQQRYDQYAQRVNDQSRKLLTLRGLFDIKEAANPISIDEVEPASEIVKRFATGAMSFGSISYEAHSTLAVAMNRIGGKSNSGEGGEEPERFVRESNGDLKRSAIKQVASGRFGVTTHYLVNADDIQIKMAQGAKPGEGGQLPGHKVNRTIARVRHSTPGVGLISPPPHHDIYSIEDLAQLIYDLKNVNPKARISVKLVSEVGVGTVAAGVSKAHADHVTISGFDGGTGASPLTSIKHAGSPWEIGLAETHQTLVLNKLRGRIAVQADGGMRTGRDVVIGALLGADEFGFATVALIAEGCIMMRKCHLNTCPVGVATQDPELRKKFLGQPEHVIAYFMFVAEEVRKYMASMGFRKFEEMIGHSEMLDMRKAMDHWKARGLDYSRILTKPEADEKTAVFNCEVQDHGLDKQLDNKLIAEAKPALKSGTAVQITTDIRNTDRSVGAMLSGRVAEAHGHEGLPEDTISVKLKGTAGQSFGAWVARGVTLELEGEANDYVGKGLSGGRLVVYPAAECPIVAEDNMIVGNTVLYGAIAGECYFRGIAGERFAVRNSGAIAVVEGTGDHGCEYMTGGVVVVLGATGRNFAAGMSGGIAYVLDEAGDFEMRCNMAMVELEPVMDEAEALEDLDHQGLDLETHGRVDVMADMTRHDALRLRQLIEKHAHYTDSARAKIILENWEQMLPKFRKIMPVEYRRALQEMQIARNVEKQQAGHGLRGGK